MGNDGGSIARRDDMVRTKATLQKADPDTLRQALWTLCTLSRQPLRPPIVSDSLGRLYNKDAVVQYLLSRSDRPKGGPDDITAGHIRGLKDVTQLNLTKNPEYKPPSPSSDSSESTSAPFLCSLTGKEMNGKHRFVYLSTCGCVMSESGLKAIASESNPTQVEVRHCPLCAKEFHALALVKGKDPEAGGEVVVVNPSQAEEDEMRKSMLSARVSKKKDIFTDSEKKRRKAAKIAARTAADDDALTSTAKRAKLEQEVRPGVNAARKVAQVTNAGKKPVSAAIASIYGVGKDTSNKDSNWMTRGTFNRYA